MNKRIIPYLLIVFFVVVLSGCNNEKTSDINNEINHVEKTIVEDNYETKEQEEKAELKLSGKIIVVDAGHGINSYNKQEPVAPNSAETKPAFAGGTAGKNQTEEQLNLKVASKLEHILQDKGADVHMTRTDNKCDMTNIDRAEYANNLNADLSVRIHADGSENSSVRGISMLVPANKYVSQVVYDSSLKAGQAVLDEVIKKTDAQNRGMVERSDLTGFNWSKVPVILIEMGFMTNPDDDILLGKDEYQQTIAEGIANGILNYFENIE